MPAPRLHRVSGAVWTLHERLVDIGTDKSCEGHVRVLWARVTRPAQKWVQVGAYCDRCGAVKVVRGEPA